MRRRNSKVKLLIGLAIAVFAIIKYYSQTDTNEYTGKKQHISISADQEIAIGLQSAPQMAEQHGGLYPNQDYQNIVKNVGQKLVQSTIASKTPYKFNFYLLRDPQTINAFALPGGQVFITYALFSKLKTKDQLAGVLGHEIGHVVGRHSAERMAKQGLTQGILSGVAVGFDPHTAQGAAAIANVLNLKYGRNDELEADNLGVRFMIASGYNPNAMIEVMEILKKSAGPNRIPERMSTHPDPENRIAKIKEAIQQYSR